MLVLFTVLQLAPAALAAPSDSPADDDHTSSEAEDRVRVFMPTGELGPAWFADPNLGTGLMVRTSLEARYRRVRASFLRVSYDATSAPYTTTRASDQASLTSSATVHEGVLGGGMRLGPDHLQVVAAISGGLRVALLPTLQGGPSDLTVENRSITSAVVVPSVGVELYAGLDTALTLDASGRLPFARPRQSSVGPAFAATIGVSTAL